MTKKLTIFALLLLMLSIGYIANAEVFTFSLADGKTVKCEIIEVTKDTITVKEWLGSRGFQKLDKTFKWFEISDKHRDMLKNKFGIPLGEDLSASEFIRWGQKIETTDGKTYQGFVDKEASTDKTTVIYCTDKRRRRIAITRVQSTEKVKVDIRKCMSANRIYNLVLTENYPISARDHYSLAAFCERIGAVRQAISHYKKAEAKDIRFSYAPDIVKNRIADLDAKYKEQFAADLLTEAKDMLKKRKFKEASNLISRILESYSDTKAAIEAAQLEREIKDKVDMLLATDVVGDYYKLIDNMIRKRVSGKVLDGPSQPGFKIVTKRRTIEGVLTDENGKSVPPPAVDDMDFVDEEGDEYGTSGSDYIYVTVPAGYTVEILRSIIKSMEPCELNKNTKKPLFEADHKTYLSGKDSQLNRDIRSKLSFKYGLSEKEIKDMWGNRAVERRTIENKIIRKSLAQKIRISYGQGTFFSPRMKNKVDFNGRKGLRPRLPIPGVSADQFFDSMSTSTRIATLKGIFAENSLNVDLTTLKATVCSTCKGTGRSKRTAAAKPPANGGRNGGGRNPAPVSIPIGCNACHGIGASLSFIAK